MDAMQRTHTLVFDEKERFAEFHSLNIPDTPPDIYFDRYTRRAADILKVPMAAVSLIDEGRRRYMSSVGIDVRQTPLEEYFCFHALKHEIVEVSDTLEDGFFCHHPIVVNSPFIRFYMGTLLHGPNGQLLGTLCIMDTTPRASTRAQRSWLAIFGQLVEDLINRIHAQPAVRKQWTKDSSAGGGLTTSPYVRKRTDS